MRARIHWVARLTGAPAWRWADLGDWRARARRWWVYTVMRYDSETCDACGRRVGCAWWVEDDGRWREVYAHLMGSDPTKTPWGVSGGFLCPGCFARGATTLGIRVTCSLGIPWGAS